MEPSSSSSSASFAGHDEHDDATDSQSKNGLHGAENGAVTIYQFSGNPDWRLPSIDPQCLRIQAYFKFCGIAFNVNNCNNPNASPTKKLPIVAFDMGTTVADPVEIIRFTNKMGYDLDRHLSFQHQADLAAFHSLVEDSLEEIHLYHLWMVPENVDSTTQLLYSSRLPFPANWWVPRMMKRNIQARLSAKLPSDQEKVYRKAADIYTALSRKLGSNEFFFGNIPTTFDALAFGYLLNHLTMELPNQRLKALVASHENLKQFCDRILTKYFGEEPLMIHQEPLLKFLERKNKKSAPKEDSADDKDFKRASAYSVMFGLLTLVVFGLMHTHPLRAKARQLMAEHRRRVAEASGENPNDEDDGDDDADFDADDE